MPLYEVDGQRPSLPADGSCWVAPSADVIGDARMGAGVSIWFGAVIRADNTPIVIGEGTNIQECAVLHSDPGSPLSLGRGCTVGHRATLHGCTLGNNVLVGMGATILNDAVIGDDCLIGAGALITEGKEFAPGSLIIGVPAKAVRELAADAIEALRKSAEHYVARSAAFASGLRRID